MSEVYKHELIVFGDNGSEVASFIESFDITKWAPQPSGKYKVKTGSHPVYGGEVLFSSETTDTVFDNLLEAANRHPELEFMLTWVEEGEFAHGFAGSDALGYYETTHGTAKDCDCGEYSGI